MQLLGALNQTKARTKLVVKRLDIIAHHFQPAAFRGAFRTRCADDHVAACLYTAGNLADVSTPVLGSNEEVEYCSVMPDVVCSLLQLDFRYIAD